MRRKHIHLTLVKRLLSLLWERLSELPITMVYSPCLPTSTVCLAAGVPDGMVVCSVCLFRLFSPGVSKAPGAMYMYVYVCIARVSEREDLFFFSLVTVVLEKLCSSQRGGRVEGGGGGRGRGRR